MNSYFKSPTEVDLLFQQGLEALRLQGWYDGCALDVALRHDPYHSEAHYALALYHASRQQLDSFRHHVRICYNLDTVYLERILTRDVVLRAFSPKDIDEVRKRMTQAFGETTPVKQFSLLEPKGNEVLLSIRPGFHEEIADFYNSLPANTARYFNNDVPYDGDNPVLTAIEVDDFKWVHYFQLEYHTDRDHVDSPPERLYRALKAVSPYIHDIRFFISDESSDVDEVVIQDSKFYLYRHQLVSLREHDSYYRRRQYYEALAEQHDDGPLRQWLHQENVNHVLNLVTYRLREHLDEVSQREIKTFIASASPDEPCLPYVHGKLLLQQNNIKDAIAHFKLSVSRSFRVFEVCYELGKLQALHTREWEESIRHFTQALEVRNFTDIYLYRALAYLRSGREAQADADLDRYVEQVQPFSSFMLTNAGVILSDAGFNTRATKLFLVALEKNEAYDNELQTQWDKAPKDESFYIHHREQNKKRRADIYTGLANCATDPTQVLAYAQQALTFAEDATRLYNIGLALQQLQRTVEAEAWYDRALLADPTYIRALHNKAIVRFGLRDYAATIALTNQVLAIDKDHAEAMNTQAGAHFHQGELLTALTLYRQYVARKPDAATGHYGIGFILSHLRQDAKAIPHIEKAVAISPHGAQSNEMYSNLGNCYNNIGALEKSIAACEHSIALNATYYHPYYVMACVLHKQGHDHEALAMARKAIACDASQRNVIIQEPDLTGMRDKMIKLL